MKKITPLHIAREKQESRVLKPNSASLSTETTTIIHQSNVWKN